MRWISQALIVGLAILATNCGKVDPSLLEGTWLATRTEARAEGDFGNAEQNTKLPEAESFYYKFDRGQMTVPVPNSAEIRYQASYQLDGSTLRLVPTSGERIEFEILSLSEEELVLRRKVEEGSKSAYTDVVFKRISTGVAPSNQPTMTAPPAYPQTPGPRQ